MFEKYTVYIPFFVEKKNQNKKVSVHVYVFLREICVDNDKVSGFPHHPCNTFAEKNNERENSRIVSGFQFRCCYG